MLKRRALFFVVAVAIVGGLVFALIKAISEREPEYEGKKLSEWLMMLDFKYIGPAGQHPMRRALHCIGTNAIPYLLEWQAYQPPAWKIKLRDTVNPILGRLHPSLELRDNKAMRAEHAGRALCLYADGQDAAPILCALTDKHARQFIPFFIAQLGTNAHSAIPALRSLLTDPDPNVRTIATNQLRKIAPEAMERAQQ